MQIFTTSGYYLHPSTSKQRLTILKPTFYKYSFEMKHLKLLGKADFYKTVHYRPYWY